MAVLIESMEMPTSCRKCDFSQPDGCGFFCPITVGKPIVDSLTHSRHARCPLIPVPPHGWLGDLDAIEKQINYIANLQWNKDVGASGGMLAALDMVEDAQTIIPSSKEG